MVCKRGHFNSHFRERFFVLKEGVVHYYKLAIDDSQAEHYSKCVRRQKMRARIAVSCAKTDNGGWQSARSRQRFRSYLSSI